MRLWIPILLMLSPAALAAGEPETTELTGWVSDENCGALHTTPGREDCVEKCIKGAPHLNPEWVAQRMVFVTDGDEAIWFVENPELLKGEEGRHLRIEAVLLENDEEKTLRVLNKARVDDSP